jgi:DNA recombination protein Rad52
MGFETGQVRKLRAKLKPRHVRSRRVEGTELHYLEGWHVTAEANRIFGFDGWDRETVETKCVWTKQNGSRFSAAYITRIRITVKAGDTSIVREGSGAGEAHEATPGLAHDRAAKAAETDATKRALMTFGNAFGLSLYAGPTEPTVARSSDRRPSGRSAVATWPAGSGTAMPPDGSTAADIATEPERDGDVSPGQAAIKRTTVHPAPEGQHKDDAEAKLARHPEQATDQHPASSTGVAEDTPAADSRELPEWPVIDPFEEAVRRAEARGRIDKSQLALSEPRRERDPHHLKRVASRPCLVCGRNRAQAHHLTHLQPRAMGRKVSDEFTVPLCSTHHRELHGSGNERIWWGKQGIDPVPVAKELWQASRKVQQQVGLAEPARNGTGESSTAAGHRGAANGAGADR